MSPVSGLPGFNPTMVRLLQDGDMDDYAFRCSFNPTMVRLLRRNGQHGLTLLRVSIPQWCDCCLFVP